MLPKGCLPEQRLQTKASPHIFHWVTIEPQVSSALSAEGKCIFLSQPIQLTAYISSRGLPQTLQISVIYSLPFRLGQPLAD